MRKLAVIGNGKGQTKDMSFRLPCKVVILFAFVAALNFSSQPAQAQTLYGALTSAYHNNPTLRAAQNQALSTNETYRQAVGAALPTISGTGSFGYSDTRGTSSSTQNGTNIGSLGISASQPLYRGGGIGAGIRSTELGIQAQWYQLQSVEQSVLLQTVQAYMNVVRDGEILSSARNDVHVLENQLSAAQARYDVGEGTRSDVALAQSALSGAHANVAAATGNLAGSKAVFVQIVGQEAVSIQSPGLPANLPYSLDDTVQRAIANDPLVIAALYLEKAAHEQVAIRKAAALPSADLQASYTANWDVFQSQDPISQDARVLAQLTVPFYQGGRAVSAIKQAKHDLNTAMIQVDEQRRRARQVATSAWYSYQSSLSIAPARQAQLDAARIALEGVQAEYDVGTKTILDVLQAEQRLFQSNLDITRTRVDRIVAAYSVVAAVGDMTSTILGLPVNHFDIRRDFKRVKQSGFNLNFGN